MTSIKELPDIYEAQDIIKYLLDKDKLYFFPVEDEDGEAMGVHINSSDLFGWGYSAYDPVADEDLFGLHEAVKAFPKYGTDIFLCKKHNRKPQAPLEKLMRDAGEWDKAMESLPDN